jgi:hypothetical protein
MSRIGIEYDESRAVAWARVPRAETCREPARTSETQFVATIIVNVALSIGLASDTNDNRGQQIVVVLVRSAGLARVPTGSGRLYHFEHDGK